MRQSKAEIYLHFVWVTAYRQPFLTGEVGRCVCRCIEAQCREFACAVLALGGMPDHVHLLVKVPTRVSAARLMNQVKGVSSHVVREQVAGTESFRWQEGYGVFSVGRSQVERVKDYVLRQKEHHAGGTVHPAWEEADDECPDGSAAPAGE